MKALNKIFWGLFFLVAAAFVIVNQLGYYTDLAFMPLILSIFLVALFIKSIYPTRFFGILISIALLIILYDKQLGLESITPWPVLITAVLGSIGLHIIFGKNYSVKCNEKHFDKVINNDDEDVINVEVKFGSSIKYVNSDNFKEANLSSSFGSLSVYFNNAKIKDDKAVINLDASFSGVELYIPKEWKVINNLDNSLAGVEEMNNRNNETNKTVTINGRVSFAGVEIIYI